MVPLKIAVGGAHSTGKSTFMARLKDELQARNVNCSVVSDLASKCPLPILKDHTLESTLWIVSSGIAAEIDAAHKSRVVLVDRSVVDAWAYLRAGKNSSTQNQNSPVAITLRNAIRDWLPTYTLTYQTVLDENIPIQNTKNRLMDAAYRSEVARQMGLACKEFKVSSRPLSVENADSELEFALRQVDEQQLSR